VVAEQGTFDPMVPDGTPLNEAVSILIKEMRRGNELEALYWARQIEGGGYWKYLFRRLAIFACEDVGTGNSLAITVVESCKTAYTDAMAALKGKRGGAKPDGNLITHVVRVLTNSEKNRENDHLKNVEHVLRSVGWRPEIPEYAIDAHTKRGRELYKDKSEKDVLWFTEWSEVTPEVGPFDWRLWHLRRLVKEGSMNGDEVEALAKEWQEKGLLAYGTDGPVEVVKASGK
jgi:MgsA AAA+ ATPase C terminal